jgi:hypothetical protein
MNPLLNTDVEVKHVLDIVADSVLGTEMWSATLVDGISLVVGNEFRASETDSAAANRTADPLVVKLSGASGPYEIDAGTYTIFQLCSRISAWLAQALDDGDLTSAVHVSITGVAWNAPRGQIRVQTPNLGGGVLDFVQVNLSFPKQVYDALGGFQGAFPDGGGPYPNWKSEIKQTAPSTVRYESMGVPMRTIAGVGDPPTPIVLKDVRGIFHDQQGSLPVALQPLLGQASGFEGAGMVLLDNKIPCLVILEEDDADETTPWRLLKLVPFDIVTGLPLDPPYVQVPFDQPGEASITQMFIFVDTFANHLKKMFFSTGSTGYNHPVWDVYPHAMGLGIPGELLGDQFIESCDALSSSDMDLPLIVTKPKKLIDLIGGDLKLRFAFLRWANEGLQFWSWMTPFSEV